MPLEQILQHMDRTDEARQQALQSYKAVRRYHLKNGRFNQKAEALVNISYIATGEKTFHVVSESGSGVLRSRVFKRMIEAEAAASKNRQGTRFTAENYKFKLLRTEPMDGRMSYVLDIDPIRPTKYMVKGLIWVDTVDYAVIRFEGKPAVNPSFWMTNTRIMSRYAKSGDFWLPFENRSKTDARLFGETEITIHTTEYQLEATPVAVAGTR